MTAPRSVAPFYEGWRLANDRLTAALAPLTPQQLALLVRPGWPIWASASHIAGARVYWLCHVFGEPGLETTPFGDPDRGWEDDLAHPRSARELAGALEATWRIVAHTLDTWAPDSLEVTARRVRAGVAQLHTRQAVLWRLITHDVFHASEISLVLGANGLEGPHPNGPIDLWTGLSRPGS